MKPLILTTLFAVSSLIAQTTGVPGVNDYTITGAGFATGSLACGAPAAGLGGTSGSTSGTPGTDLTFDAFFGGTLTFNVSCAPGSLVQMVLSPVPCVPCFVGLPPVTYPIPFTACGSNQSVDLNLTQPLRPLFTGIADGSGNFGATIPFPPAVLGCQTFCTQAVVIDASQVSGFVVTQAYDLTFI